MKRIEIKRPSNGAPQGRYEGGNYIPPNIARSGRSMKVVKLSPVKEIGPPDPSRSIVIEVTPKDYQNRLDTGHYNDGGSYIGFEEMGNYFTTQQQETPGINLDALSNEDYFAIEDKVRAYLFENNYATKAILNKIELAELLDKYKVPSDLLTNAKN